MTRKIMATSDLSSFIAVHYGIPATASILAFDSIQRLLAVGTLDGRIKVVGGENIEGLLISPKSLPFKNLEFFQNQGLLVSVSNENEIQVWDLDKRCIACNVQWESNITAFSVISGTSYMYAGDEYGFLSVLKYDAEERNIIQLPYHMPPNLIAEGAGIPVPENQSIVGVLSQPFSSGKRVLIAYGNGLIILWDVTEDKAIHVTGNKNLELKGSMVLSFSNNETHAHLNNLSDEDEAEKEIGSLCWASLDGSVLAVGYVDGDILLWDLSVSDNGKSRRTDKPSNDVVKIQLSSGDRRLPVILLHWSSSKAQNGCGGQLFAYGGEDIGSEEVLTMFDLDWSSGLAKLKCIERVDLRLHGSFADILVTSNAYEEEENQNATSLFILTYPGQLHLYEYESLSTLKSEKGKNGLIHSSKYNSVIPTVEPYMNVGKLYTTSIQKNIFDVHSEAVSPSRQWPMTGGVMNQTSISENKSIERIYIGGYQDGSVRIWDATLPVLSLASVFGLEVKNSHVEGSSASISALDLCHPNLTIAIGNEYGLIFLYSLDRTHNNITILTESICDVVACLPEDRNSFSTIYSIIKSPVRALKLTSCGTKLFAGFDCGKVMVLDTELPSVLLTTDNVSSSLPVFALAFTTFRDTLRNPEYDSDHGIVSESAKDIAVILTKDAHMVLMDSLNGSTISSLSFHHKENSVAINLHLFESAVESPVAATMDSNILLCCEKVIRLYPFKSLLQGNDKPVRKLELDKTCSWTAIFKKDVNKSGLILLYQTGEIEARSLPELELVGCTSLMLILRWNFKNYVVNTMSASDRGLITLVNGREFAFVSLLGNENEFRIPQSLPCLHDKGVTASTTGNNRIPQKSKRRAITGFVNNMIKGLKLIKADHNMDYNQAQDMLAEHLEIIFSRFPFSDPYNSYDLDETELKIDDIEIDLDDEPVIVVHPLHKDDDDEKTKDEGNERRKLFEGGSSDTQPRIRTHEEIIAKYRKTDAVSAASQAKDKLLERQEKLERLSRRTEELQSGAENFASMAQELAKAMEKKKWWNL